MHIQQTLLFPQKHTNTQAHDSLACLCHRHISGCRNHAAHGLQYNARLFPQKHTNTQAHDSLACLCQRHISGRSHQAAHGLQKNARLFPQKQTNTQAHNSLACLCHLWMPPPCSSCIYNKFYFSHKNIQTHKHMTHSHASATGTSLDAATMQLMAYNTMPDCSRKHIQTHKHMTHLHASATGTSLDAATM